MQHDNKPNSDDETFLSRRKFLQIGGTLAAGASIALSAPAQAVQLLNGNGARDLGLYNIHTGENCNVTFWENGQYLTDGIAEINHLLRDHRTGEIAQIDTRLLDLLYRVHQTSGASPSRRFEIISGYRSSTSNLKIRKVYGKGVATRSMHMDGKAVDIRLPGTNLEHLKKAALTMKSGGVGFYPRDNFLHVDVGRVRFWTGNKT